MNVERLTVIAEWLEAGAKPRRFVKGGFNMSWFFGENNCGTTCCIGGAAQAFFGLRLPKFLAENRDPQKILGLTDMQADELFYELTWVQRNTFEQERAHAARCIRNLIATGKVDWKGTRISTSDTVRLS